VHEGREPKLWGPYTEQHPFHEPFVLFGYLAGVTTTLELETSVIILPQRQTVLAAKQAAEVDVLSGGRLRLGLGTGWNYVEYEGLDVPWAKRGKRFDEQIELLRRLWGDPVVDYKGTFHRIDRAGIAPRPAHQIPIWLGGGSDVSLRRAARTGDGFTFAGAGRSVAAQAAKLRGYLSEEGRDPATFPMEFGLPYGLGPERWQKSVELAQNDGITHFSVNTMSSAAAWARTDGSGLSTPAEHIAGIEQFIKTVRG
jgi:probable F420-dependent oxidoreductase